MNYIVPYKPESRKDTSLCFRNDKEVSNDLHFLPYLYSNIEISPGISLDGMMLKLKLQYLGHLMRRVDTFWKRL